MKIALILEGGGMRGVYTAGILDYFMDNKINFFDCFGVSAGTCCAINYKSKQPGRSINMNLVFAKDPRYLGVRTYLKKRNFFNLDFIFDEVAKKYMRFDFNTFKNNSMNLYSVSTNVLTGKAEYFLLKDLKSIDMEFAKSSCAIPILTKIRTVNDYKLLDGGVADPIPYQKALDSGFDKVVIVLTRNKGFRLKEKGDSIIFKKIFKDYKDFLDTLNNHNKNYNKCLDEIENLEATNKAFCFYPSKPLKMDKTEKDRDKLFDLYNNGYEDAANLAIKLKEFVEEADNVTYQEDCPLDI